MKFFIPMRKIPTATHQEKQVRVVNGKPVFYEPPRVKEARQLLRDHLAKRRPEEKLKGPIGLYVMWCFPKTDKHKEGELKITRPDTDNLEKLLKDEMTYVGFWKDDALVAVEHIEKRYSKIPGLLIEIKEL